MAQWIRMILFDFPLFLLGLFLIYIGFFSDWLVNQPVSFQLPPSFLQLNTIFLSILIEAVPFVLLGVLIAGGIQIFISEEQIQKWIPKNKFLAVLMSCVIGACFPACECGIVPIVRRLVAKGVPIYAGIGFLLTGPLINPIVIFSTYMAFGNDLKIAALRMGIGFVAALIIAFIISLVFNKSQLKHLPLQHTAARFSQQSSFFSKFWSMVKHAIDEFFDMGKYLVLGAFFAAFVQTYVSAQSLLQVGDGWASSTIVMMGLAFLLSLCSEADAFIGASFRNLFPMSSILAFLVYGPMLDLKNTLMLFSVFKARFVLYLMALITVTVFMCVSFLSGL